MKNGICKTFLTLVAVVIAVFAGPAQAGPLGGQLGILTPDTLAGNNPATGTLWAIGDTYRFAFFTSATTTAVSSDISTYNTWVQGLANASTAYDIGVDEDVTWKVIGSTGAVDARDNTSTNPTVETGCAVFLLDGSTLIASDYADLWDGEIQHIIDLTEQGNVYTWWPWTGTSLSGTATGALGNGDQVVQGRSDVTTEWIWRENTMDPPTFEHNMYALSETLVIVSTDPNFPSVDAGVDMITWTGQEVNLDATVVNNDSEVPQRALSYLWSADAVSMADTNLTITITDADQEDATVEITKTDPTGDATAVTMTLAVTLEGEEPLFNAMALDVYDDNCLAAIAADPELTFDRTDLDENCITNLADFVAVAETWLVDYELTAPAEKP